MNSKISQIEHQDKNITAIIDSNGVPLPIKNLVYTASLHQLLKSLNPKPPQKILDYLGNIEYRSIFICAIYLDMKNFSSNASIYFRILIALLLVFTNRKIEVRECPRKQDM